MKEDSTTNIMQMKRVQLFFEILEVWSFSCLKIEFLYVNGFSLLGICIATIERDKDFFKTFYFFDGGIWAAFGMNTFLLSPPNL